MALTPATLTSPINSADVSLSTENGAISFTWEAVANAIQYAVSIFKYHGTTLVDSIYMILPAGVDGLDLVNNEFFESGTFNWNVAAFDSDGLAYTSANGVFVTAPASPTTETTTVSSSLSPDKPQHTLSITRSADWTLGVNTPLQQEHKRYYDISYESVAVDGNLDPLFSGTAVANSTTANPAALFTNIDIVDGWIYTITPYVYVTDTDGTSKKITGTPVVTEALGDINSRAIAV